MTIMNVTSIQLWQLPLPCFISLLNVKVCCIRINEVWWGFFADLDGVISSNGATFLIPVSILCKALCRLGESSYWCNS